VRGRVGVGRRRAGLAGEPVGQHVQLGAGHAEPPHPVHIGRIERADPPRVVPVLGDGRQQPPARHQVEREQCRVGKFAGQN
jgi:hypothetical protein